MYIKNLKLNNFRNYKYFDIDFGSGFNVIYGENGQGKTNILEALFMCATGRSHRTSHDIDLINTEAESFCIDLFFFSGGADKNIRFRYNDQKQKSISVNDINIRKIGELMGNLNAVIFSPEDLMIIKQGPAQRRRFIDIALSQIKPYYFYYLQQYNKTLLQRNSLLKQIKKNRSFIETIDIWDSTLSSLGENIIKERKIFSKEICELIRENHFYISGEKEELKLLYEPSVEEGDFLKKLKQNINGDIERESTSSGPHRDDFSYFINGENLKIYGSQGQQRTAVLSSKLAELSIMKKDAGESPILLLDDVLSELDEKRQKFLFDRIDNIQTFITCTSKNVLKNRLNFDVKYFNIVNGQLNLK